MKSDALKRFVNASSERVKSEIVPVFNAFRDFFQPDTLNGADGVRKVFVYNFPTYSDSLEKLRGLLADDKALAECKVNYMIR